MSLVRAQEGQRNYKAPRRKVEESMARYDYKCPDCKVSVEVERPMTDSESAPMCSCGTQMQRVWDATPAHFKGGGWGGQ